MPNGLNNLKGKVDKLNVDNLPQVPTDLRKLRDVVENEAVEKDVYDAMIKDIEDKISSITKLTINAALNAKIMRLKVKYLVILT